MSDALLPVLDSHALLTWLQDEAGADEVEAALRNAQTVGGDLPLCVVNWTEALYIVRRERGQDAMDNLIAAVDQLPIRLVEADRELALTAATLKAEHPISLADAYCAATAMLHGAPVLTADPEFRPLEGTIQVLWTR